MEGSEVRGQHHEHDHQAQHVDEAITESMDGHVAEDPMTPRILATDFTVTSRTPTTATCDTQSLSSTSTIWDDTSSILSSSSSVPKHSIEESLNDDKKATSQCQYGTGSGLMRMRHCKYLCLAVVFYAFTLILVLVMSLRYTVLRALSVTSSIFLLNLLSKAGDFAFGLATAELFENVLTSQLDKGAVPMPKVLALSPSTGISGLARIVYTRFRAISWQTRQWAALQLGLLFLIAGPGLLLMANVNPELFYVTGDPHSVTAGISAYTPKAAHIYGDAARIAAPALLRNMLQDSKTAAQVEPLSEACKSTNCNCTSAILSAGMQNVRPHIIRKESDCSNLAVIRLEHVPSYQFDVWAGGLDTPSLDNLSCTIYGSLHARFQLCIGIERGQAAILKAGWRSCNRSSDSSNATQCDESSSNLLNSSSPMWTAISIAAWNRTATHILSMIDGSIKYVEELGSPRPLLLEPAELFVALDELFLPMWTMTTIVGQASALRSTITTLLASMLELPDVGISQPWMGSEAKERYLANTVLMPLFLYHDLFLGSDLMTRSEYLDLQIGEAFHVPVSFAEHEVATPATWSIIAYAALGGVILFAIAIGQVLILRRSDVAKSNFPLVDIALHYNVVEESGKAPGAPENDPNSSRPARTRLRSGGGGTSSDVLRRAARLKMCREVA